MFVTPWFLRLRYALHEMLFWYIDMLVCMIVKTSATTHCVLWRLDRQINASLLRQWGCSGPAIESLPHLCETTDRLTIMLFCDIYDIDIGATLNLLQCLHVSCFIDLIDYVPGIGYGSIIDFHSVSWPGYGRTCARKCRRSRKWKMQQFWPRSKTKHGWKQPCANATSFTHRPIFISISLLCNHSIYYRQMSSGNFI